MFAGHLGRRQRGAEALHDDLALLLGRPASPPLAAWDDIDPRAAGALMTCLMSVLSVRIGRKGGKGWCCSMTQHDHRATVCRNVLTPHRLLICRRPVIKSWLSRAH